MSEPKEGQEATNNRKRIAIVGARGRLGAALVGALSWEYDIIPIPRDRLDFTRPDHIDSVLGPIDCDLLINTAAYTDVDGCETDPKLANLVNAETVGTIGRHMAGRGIRVIHYSTDYVFDGEKESPYVETDEPNPLSVYGESKLKGEQLLLEASVEHLVIRVCWVFGPGRPGFPDWLVGNLAKAETFSVVEDKIGSPTYTIDCCAAVRPLLFGSTAVGGVMHLTNNGSATWQEWAQACADSAVKAGANLKTTQVGGIPMDSIEAFRAKRPRNSALSLERYEKITGTRPRSWRESVSAFFEDHYNISSL